MVWGLQNQISSGHRLRLRFGGLEATSPDGLKALVTQGRSVAVPAPTTILITNAPCLVCRACGPSAEHYHLGKPPNPQDAKPVLRRGCSAHALMPAHLEPRSPSASPSTFYLSLSLALSLSLSLSSFTSLHFTSLHRGRVHASGPGPRPPIPPSSVEEALGSSETFPHVRFGW